MDKKKLYEEAKIEVIKFECKDILTTSDVIDPDGELVSSDQGGNGGGDIVLPPIEL